MAILPLMAQSLVILQVSGVVLVGMNRGVSLARRFRNAKLLSTFQVEAEFVWLTDCPTDWLSDRLSD